MPFSRSNQLSWRPNGFVGDHQTAMLRWLAEGEVEQLIRFQPIFVYGPAESGKTFLATILAEKILSQSDTNDATSKRCFLNAADLDRRIRHAVVVDSLESTLSALVKLPLLVVDEAHRFSTSELVDRSLATLVERRLEANKPSLFCGSMSPWEMSERGPRLAAPYRRAG